MASEFAIRKANLDDLDCLIEMRLALLREVGYVAEDSHDIDELIDAQRRYFTEELASGKYVGFAADVNGNLVGTGGLVFLHRPPYRGNASGLETYLMNVYTIPEWRGRGIATAVVAEILAFARRSGTRRVWLHAQPEASGLYQKAGSCIKTRKWRSSSNNARYI
jgi:GNAT superfamily N-acetyltransferase